MGNYTSPLPVPKIYEASHGMCQVCGNHWLAAVGSAYGAVEITQTENGSLYVHSTEESLLCR